MLGCSRLGVDILLLKQNSVYENNINKYNICEHFQYIEKFVKNIFIESFVQVAKDVK